MKKVRDTLGDEAIIVATREEPGGKSVSVTAAVDNDSYAKHKETTERIQSFLEHVEKTEQGDQSRGAEGDAFESYSDPALDGDWTFGDDMEENTESEAIIEVLTDVMIRHGASAEVTDEILSCATVLGLEDPRVSLVAALENLYKFNVLPKTPSRKAFMLVGPPGSGKTLAVAKLAARSVMDGLSVGVISTDVVRAGGLEQLQAFTKILDIDLLRAGSASELKRKMASIEGADQIIIDTGGANPFDPEEMRGLAKMIAAGSIEPVLVLPAGTDAHESSDIARTFAAIGTRTLLPTRLDIARRLGGLLTAAHQGGLRFADASHTSQVAEGLIDLSPRVLADYLMPKSSKKGRGNNQADKSTEKHKSSNPAARTQRHKTEAGQQF